MEMEIRRVQVTGGASFVVTLPKDWAEAQKIAKNDPVGLIVQPDGTLLITKKITEDPVQRIKEIDSSTLGDPAFRHADEAIGRQFCQALLRAGRPVVGVTICVNSVEVAAAAADWDDLEVSEWCRTMLAFHHQIHPLVIDQ